MIFQVLVGANGATLDCFSHGTPCVCSINQVESLPMRTGVEA
jgi:hypothetical protein